MRASFLLAFTMSLAACGGKPDQDSGAPADTDTDADADTDADTDTDTDTDTTGSTGAADVHWVSAGDSYDAPNISTDPINSGSGIALLTINTLLDDGHESLGIGSMAFIGDTIPADTYHCEDAEITLQITHDSVEYRADGYGGSCSLTVDVEAVNHGHLTGSFTGTLPALFDGSSLDASGSFDIVDP